MTGALRTRKSLGRYAIYDQIGAGGMATVHLGRMRGALGFALTVAVKRLLPAYVKVRPFVEMFVDEARLSARVRHPNVVPIFDVVAEDRELFLVMEYVPGVTLADLLALASEKGERLPPRVATGILCGALEGLHAAHEAKSERGEPLGLVHRDVSPQNILVGADGIARVLDFGVAKAAGRVHASAEGTLKGKIQYMAPEHLAANITSRASDIYSAAVVLWEALTGRRLFQVDTMKELVEQRLLDDVEPPSKIVPDLPRAIDAIIRRATAQVPEARFATAREMSAAIEEALPGAPSEVSAWVQRVAAEELASRAAVVSAVERRTAGRVDTAIAWIGRAEITDELPSGDEPGAPSESATTVVIGEPADDDAAASMRAPLAPSKRLGTKVAIVVAVVAAIAALVVALRA
jgi:eukaryotic-like serine/threonine-protein kinase